MIDLMSDGNDVFSVEIGIKIMDIPHVHLNAVLNSIWKTPLFARSSFQNCVWSDPSQEMGPQVRRKFRELAVTERLDRPDNRGCVDFVAFGEFTRRQKKGIVGIFQDRADQLFAAGIQMCSRVLKARLERRAPRSTFAGTVLGLVHRHSLSGDTSNARARYN